MQIASFCNFQESRNDIYQNRASKLDLFSGFIQFYAQILIAHYVWHPRYKFYLFQAVQSARKSNQKSQHVTPSLLKLI
jgi:hypothetical protein